MRAIANPGSRRFTLFFLTVFLAVACGAFAQPKTAARPAIANRTSRAADAVLIAGYKATIPPHLSHLLGIAAEGADCPVSQRFQRDGQVVRGFEVSITDKNDIVIFVADEAANQQAYYLSSSQGRLRKIVGVKNGTGNVVPFTPEQTGLFRKELQFWLDQIVPDKRSK